MTDWVKVLRAIAPKGRGWIINGVAENMPRMIQMAELTTPLRLAHFLAQCAHESDGFNTTEEYASGAAYEGRADLGNMHPGDGVKFKGHGVIQTTGRERHEEDGKELGIDLVQNPKLAMKFPYAALLAAVYWRRKKLNRYADRDDLRGVTLRVNGGYNGLAARAAYLKAAKRVLAAQSKAAPIVEEVTTKDLRKAGSRTIAGVDQVKNGVIGGAISAGGAAITAAADSGVDPSGVISKVSDAAEQAKNIHDAAASAPDMLEMLKANWEWAVIALLAAACLYFICRTWQGANHVARARVDDANHYEIAESGFEDEETSELERT